MYIPQNTPPSNFDSMSTNSPPGQLTIDTQNREHTSTGEIEYSATMSENRSGKNYRVTVRFSGYCECAEIDYIKSMKMTVEGLIKYEENGITKKISYIDYRDDKIKKITGRLKANKNTVTMSCPREGEDGDSVTARAYYSLARILHPEYLPPITFISIEPIAPPQNPSHFPVLVQNETFPGETSASTGSNNTATTGDSNTSPLPQEEGFLARCKAFFAPFFSFFTKSAPANPSPTPTSSPPKPSPSAPNRLQQIPSQFLQAFSFFSRKR